MGLGGMLTINFCVKEFFSEFFNLRVSLWIYETRNMRVINDQFDGL